jgi:NAD(P)-dependent dehydrogenase (short-subunit alcohol dehydrogenase family)
MDIQDRVALVTGGKRIGAVVAAELAARGADVALAFKRSRKEADETAAAVRAHGRRAVTIEADLSRPEDCHALVERA